MKKIIFILSLFIFSKVSPMQAQGLQPGECGIMFTYDAAGNLEQREFICNNSGVVLYRAIPDEKNKKDSIKSTNTTKLLAGEIIRVNALMPNPTTGKFMVRLAKPLTNGNVLLLDANGKVLEKRLQSGNTLNFDISFQPSGMYFVRIESGGKAFTFKVIKE